MDWQRLRRGLIVTGTGLALGAVGAVLFDQEPERSDASVWNTPRPMTPGETPGEIESASMTDEQALDAMGPVLKPGYTGVMPGIDTDELERWY